MCAIRVTATRCPTAGPQTRGRQSGKCAPGQCPRMTAGSVRVLSGLLVRVRCCKNPIHVPRGKSGRSRASPRAPPAQPRPVTSGPAVEWGPSAVRASVCMWGRGTGIVSPVSFSLWISAPEASALRSPAASAIDGRAAGTHSGSDYQARSS